MKGTASPPDHLSYPSSAIVTCNTQGSVSQGSDGNLSYTSVSCSPISSVLRHYGVFDGTHCSADVCCGGFSGGGGHTPLAIVTH